MTCPITILLNISVILAVKKTPRLQSKPNILLACLAATDASIGLTAQPSYIFSCMATFQVSGINSLAQTICFHLQDRALVEGISNSLPHLMLVTVERLQLWRSSVLPALYIHREKHQDIRCHLLNHRTVYRGMMGYVTRHLVLGTLR